MNPFVSIVIPVYNGSDYMREAIDSALAQDYEPFEVIVVNDGSMDNGETERIALSYGNRIRYFYKKNGGVATALNYAIRKMRGEYFSWLSHDDSYYPNKIKIQIQALRKCGDWKRIIINDYAIWNSQTKFLYKNHMNNVFPVEKIENGVFSILQGLVSGCAMLIHKSHFERVGIFDESLITTQDYDLWFRMFRGQKILYIPQCLTMVRVHPNQGSKTIVSHKKEQQELHIGFINKMTNEEVLSMYESKYNFYSQMLPFAFEHVKKLLHIEEKPENINEKLLGLRDYIFSFSSGKTVQICIFCMGAWGRRLYFELESRLIHVDFFCDNDMNRKNETMGEARYISLSELKMIKEETIVIVATIHPMPITMQLKNLNFPYVLERQNLVKWFFQVPVYDADLISNEI